ncbi:Uncharacterised protein [uncultured archaeon]|nr:Uncharacterised protein [uncultured archaeon]
MDRDIYRLFGSMRTSAESSPYPRMNSEDIPASEHEVFLSPVVTLDYFEKVGAQKQ